MSRVAAVVIGRNEGPRLARCLRSVIGQFDPVVYVDSESSDGSRETARAMGAAVVALDITATPFSFGRGRNAGTARVLEIAPDADYVQYVDADSEVAATWCRHAAAALDADPRIAAVHGHVRERDPGAGLYDRLFALELDPRLEEPDVFGGMAMLRIAPLRTVGAYREDLSSFEDHELAFRLRRAGWEVRYLDTDMVLHECGMTHFRQWWTRERRTGHSRGALIAIHGTGGARNWQRAYASICFWGGVLPLLTLVGVLVVGPVAALLLLGYPVLMLRIARRMRRRGFSSGDAALYAVGRAVSKFPQLHGVLTYVRDRRPTA